MTHELVHLARSQNLDDLEAAWTQAVGAPDAERVSHYADTLDALCEQDMASKALGMATAMVDSLVDNSHKKAAMELGFRTMQSSAHNDALVNKVIELIDDHYSEAAWLPVLKQRSNLMTATVGAVLEFDRLRGYTEGHVVYHGAGWGEGVVEGFDAATQEITVHFSTGRRSPFPLDTLLDSFKPLDNDDLRAMKLLSMEQLQDEGANTPGALIRRTASLYRGTITSTQVKKELAGSVIETKKWASWWKKAKTAATKDPWLKVEGTTTRPVFVLRKKPVSLVDEASATLHHQNDLGERVVVLREYLKRSEDAEVRAQVLELAAKTVEQALEEKKANPDAGASHAHILDGILFLEEHKMKASVSAAEELRELLLEEGGQLQPTRIDLLATQASREHAVNLLPQALGGDWAEQCIRTLTDWPASVVEKVADKLVETKHGPELLSLWNRVAPYPKRHPLMTYLLGKYYSDGVFEGQEGCPDAVTMARVLLHLGRVLNEDRKSNQLHGRLLNRLLSLLTGKRSLLDKACDGISREDLAQFVGIVARAGEDFPQEVETYLDRTAARLYPDILAEPETPFWEKDEYIFTTQDGLKRIKEEYRVLVDVKIPENAQAIGAAASLGDLSENSEWESAMEEQRNLTGRAQEMDGEISSAKLIEDQEIPDDIVAPGQKITLTEEGTGKQLYYRLLGPWDATDDQTINYRAPLAKGLLGKEVGEVGEMPSPSGPVQVKIEAIERIV
ncbi:MAG: GreA/GreB family elongation factor [Planctomycetota bacterium]|nr:GreA/GreB family elongation factor [Planctomycetota bacterium]